MTGRRADITFSFVIPTFNRANVVGRAIRSALNQGADDLEVIVVDDGSTDETTEVVDGIADARLRYFRLRQSGANAARNFGSEQARGTYLVFLDSDDVLLPDWRQFFGHRLAPDTGLASCDCIREDEAGRRERAGGWGLGTGVHGVPTLLQSGTYAIHREPFQAVGGFDAELASAHHTDLRFRVLPRLAAEGRKVVHIDEPLVLHYLGSPFSIRQDDRVVLRGSEQLIERHLTVLKQSPNSLADYHGIAGISAARLGQHSRARKHFFLAIRYDPFSPKRWLRILVVSLPVGSRIWRQ